MIHDFEQYLRSLKGYAENTISAYLNDLRLFAGWMKQHRVDARWSNITRDDVDAYIISQQQRGLKPATTNRQLAAISALYRYLQRQGYEVTNPCKYESRRKIAETLPATIPTENIIAAYKAAPCPARTMLGLLATTGIRIQELLDLRWEDIDFNNNTLHITGKGSKERIVNTEAAVLDRWREITGGLTPTGKIYHFGQRRARQIIYEALRPFCHQKHLSPHTIRHTFATQLALTGCNTNTIARALGHKHISTTQKYIDMSQQLSTPIGISLT